MARAQAENTFVFRVSDEKGQAIEGNSNAGHDYGNAKLSNEDRWALVEYMKAVGGQQVGAGVQP